MTEIFLLTASEKSSESSNQEPYPTRITCPSSTRKHVHHHSKEILDMDWTCPLQGCRCHHKTVVWRRPGGRWKHGCPKTTWRRTIENSEEQWRTVENNGGWAERTEPRLGFTQGLAGDGQKWRNIFTAGGKNRLIRYMRTLISVTWQL